MASKATSFWKINPFSWSSIHQPTNQQSRAAALERRKLHVRWPWSEASKCGLSVYQMPHVCYCGVVQGRVSLLPGIGHLLAKCSAYEPAGCLCKAYRKPVACGRGKQIKKAKPKRTELLGSDRFDQILPIAAEWHTWSRRRRLVSGCRGGSWSSWRPWSRCFKMGCSMAVFPIRVLSSNLT